jgi:hypothetical protein
MVSFAQNELMKRLIPNRAELELVPDEAKASDAVAAELDLASVLEVIEARALTSTPLMEKIRFRPSSHWGINE